MKIPKRVLVIASLLALYTIWSSTYLALRYLVDGAPPLLSSGLRYTVAGAILFTGSILTGGRVPTAREWLAGLPSGALLFLTGNGFVALAEESVGSGLAAIACAAMPLFLSVFSAFSGERTSRQEWAGLALGFAGVLVLGAADLRASKGAGVLLAIAPLGWALGSFLSKKLVIARGAMGPATQMIAGGVVNALTGFAIGEAPPSHVALQTVLALAYLVFFGSIVAFSAYAYLLRETRPAVATSYAYVNPVLAVLLGVLVGHEALGKTALAATVLVVAGVAITLRAKGARASQPARSET